MKDIFIAGTDTGVGKTIITGLLGRFFLDSGLDVITQKWVETGRSDIKTHIRLMKKKPPVPISYLCPYSFKFPASPHLSARLSNKKINVNVIKDKFLFLKEGFSIVLVEGTGGILTPITEKTLILDIVKGLSLPVLLVSKNKLGTINHTLLSLEALRARNIKILGLIFINALKEKGEILEDNPRIIEKLTKVNILGILPFIKEKEKLYKAFIPIGEKIKALVF